MDIVSVAVNAYDENEAISIALTMCLNKVRLTQ